MANGFMPPGRGGNDPVRQAAIQNLNGNTMVPGSQVSAPSPAAPPAAGRVVGQGGQGQGRVQDQVGGEVAFHLANAYDALLRTGATPENRAALEQFIMALQRLNPGAQAQTGPAQAQAPVG